MRYKKEGFEFWIIICVQIKKKKPFENSSVNHNFFTTLSSLTHLQFNFRLEVNRHKNSGQNQKPLNNCFKFVFWQIASLTDLRTLQTKQK